MESSHQEWKNSREKARSHQKKFDYGRFICKGDYKLWLKVVRLISSIFTDEQGLFKPKKTSVLRWNEQFVKYCV